MVEYKNIAIYYDMNGKLIGVPCGKSPRHGDNGTVQLDIFYELEHGYNDDELEFFINKVFDACYTKIPIDGEPTAIQNYTKKRGYVAAVKGYQYMSIYWSKGHGYTFRPMQVDKKHKGAFMAVKGQLSINVTKHNKHIPLEKGALALAFRKAKEIIDETNLS